MLEGLAPTGDMPMAVRSTASVPGTEKGCVNKSVDETCASSVIDSGERMEISLCAVS